MPEAHDPSPTIESRLAALGRTQPSLPPDRAFLASVRRRGHARVLTRVGAGLALAAVVTLAFVFVRPGPTLPGAAPARVVQAQLARHASSVASLRGVDPDDVDRRTPTAPASLPALPAGHASPGAIMSELVGG